MGKFSGLVLEQMDDRKRKPHRCAEFLRICRYLGEEDGLGSRNKGGGNIAVAMKEQSLKGMSRGESKAASGWGRGRG